MERVLRWSFTQGHETSGNCPGTGTATPRGRPVAQAGAALSAITWAVGASVSSVFRWAEAYRKQGLPGLRLRPTPDRSPLSSAQKRLLGGTAPEEAPGQGLSHRFMDLETCGAADPPAVRGTLPSLSCLEAPPDPVEMELSEPRTPRAAAERGRDRPMETVPLAAYKKRRTTGRPSGLPR